MASNSDVEKTTRRWQAGQLATQSEGWSHTWSWGASSFEQEGPLNCSNILSHTVCDLGHQTSPAEPLGPCLLKAVTRRASWVGGKTFTDAGLARGFPEWSLSLHWSMNKLIHQLPLS